MKKIESLKQLIETIKENELHSGGYVDMGYQGNTPKCIHCVVGYLLKNGGMTVEQLESLDEMTVENPYQSYVIDTIIERSPHVPNDFVGKKLVEMGFDLTSKYDKMKLKKLQVINDSNQHDNMQARKDRLIELIELWIKETEIENENMA